MSVSALAAICVIYVRCTAYEASSCVRGDSTNNKRYEPAKAQLLLQVLTQQHDNPSGHLFPHCIQAEPSSYLSER